MDTARLLEIAANAFNAASILLATMNSVHTWWTGIVGCLLFSVVFFGARLYADVTLQVFFILACIAGWWNWLRGNAGAALPVRTTAPAALAAMTLAAGLVAGAYGWLLSRHTNAYAPFLDSLVLTFSVLGQLLLVRRRYESWWCWLAVNTISVPLYASRGLILTAGLYALFWVNAIVALIRWRRLLTAT
jgi:nicotinamide mononucleotide transporter